MRRGARYGFQGRLANLFAVELLWSFGVRGAGEHVIAGILAVGTGRAEQFRTAAIAFAGYRRRYLPAGLGGGGRAF